MAEFYAARSSAEVNVESIAAAMADNIDPTRSHTYRKGKSGGWREQFTAEHCRLFEKIAGDVMHKYGFTLEASAI
jgi:hypothetical protein